MHTCVLSHFSHFMSNSLHPCRAPLSMAFYRQEYWSELPCSLPEALPNQGSNQCLLHLLHSLKLVPPRNPRSQVDLRSLRALHGLWASGFVPVLLTDSELISACFKVDVRMKCTNRWSCLVMVSRQQILASTQFSCSLMSDSL